MLNYLISFFFGIIEGITEWLPVSSTGHMILFDEFVKLSMSDDFKEMFLIVIQLGAILAVVVLFFWDIWPFTTPQKGLIKKDKVSMWFKIAVACIPAVILELCLGDKIDAMFYNFRTVAIMLITVGVLFIIVENWNKGRSASVTTIDEFSYKYAFYIGMFQLVAALLPGTSRSGATIIGALLLGVSRVVAAECTVYLAIPVMFGASLLKLVKFLMMGLSFTSMELAILAVGCIVSFVVSIIVIKFLMGYIKKHDFIPFGIYRIVLGAVLLIYFALVC